MSFPSIHASIMLKSTKSQRRKFTQEEDEKLRSLVEKLGAHKWDNIAKEMPGRTGRQCRDRYKNYLVPGYFNGQWSAEEDLLLREKYLEFGSQWSKLTKFFHNRSANALKNRWNYFVSRQKIGEFDEPKNRGCEESLLNSGESCSEVSSASDLSDSSIDDSAKICDFDAAISFLADINNDFEEDIGFQCMSNLTMSFTDINEYDFGY